ncbi:MAG: hypothetical protein WCS18_10900, partial [Sphaerochaetaceae bacterium]
MAENVLALTFLTFISAYNSPYLRRFFLPRFYRLHTGSEGCSAGFRALFRSAEIRVYRNSAFSG